MLFSTLTATLITNLEKERKTRETRTFRVLQFQAERKTG